ncbi:hypothetical protein D0T57_01755 [Dysgonomonas sp. 511]|nr:hypothetical protein [Dysgonomonas sp. 511]
MQLLAGNSGHRIEEVIYSANSSKTSKTILWVSVVTFFFLALLFLNILTPLISDDFAYLYIYGEEGRISSLSDIVTSQINHYYMWGGRSVVHFIAQVLLLLPSYVADLLNAAVYMAYIWLIYLHVKGRGKNSLNLFILVNLAVWFLQPVLSDTVLWITGSANYLWGTLLVLLFLLPYRLYNGGKTTTVMSIILSPTLFIGGIVAGWTNENTAAAALVVGVLFLFYYKYKEWKLPLWAFSGLAAFFIGYLIMILAPGNFERAGESSLNLMTIAFRIFNCTLMIFRYCGPCVLVAAAGYIFFRHYGEKDVKEEGYSLSAIYAIAFLTAVYVMMLSPSFPRRALFGAVSYIIIGAGILIYNTGAKSRLVKNIRSAIIMVGLLCFFSTIYVAYKEISIYRNIIDEREALIKEAKDTGKTSCEFERFDGGTYIHGEDPFSGELMSRHYGITIELK